MLRTPAHLPARVRVMPLIIAAVVVSVANGMSDRNVSAQGLGAYGFQPYGFYQPYGVRYRSSTATPPYFALNPPVYYGTRHFRPYGISPFAAPPQVSAPAGYEGRPAASGLRSGDYLGPSSNPFICRSSDSGSATDGNLAVNRAFEPGKVQTNPFVSEQTQLVTR